MSPDPFVAGLAQVFGVMVLLPVATGADKCSAARPLAAQRTQRSIGMAEGLLVVAHTDRITVAWIPQPPPAVAFRA